MHTISTHRKVISFSGKSYRKFKECADLWKDVSFGFELENKIAAIAVNFDFDFDSFELQTEQYSPGASGGRGGVYQGGRVRTATSSTKKEVCPTRIPCGLLQALLQHYNKQVSTDEIKAKKEQYLNHCMSHYL
ncbi:uncharacterized protein LOC115925440 [Strongylocentrotus purpuratus]|uniref:Uncharacterized protein n=1 Tax=Strongylocentrotus purpuratus TaxID=7668 RepID=A0A7M7P4K2_STRPU|nr:uncharacterized protein LOC115925440 [Strongylocentrotus purpuratus]